MAPSKRTATPAPARDAKKTKVAEPIVAAREEVAHVREAKKGKTVDPLSVACKEVLSLLSRCDLPDSVKVMIEEVAPLALKDAKAERHKYQENVVSLLADLFNGIESTDAKEMELATKNVDEAVKALADAQTFLNEIRDAEKNKSEASGAAKAIVEVTAVQVSDAKQTLSSAKSKMDEMQVEHNARIVEKEERVNLIRETYTKLKSGEKIPAREKAKMIEKVMKTLHNLDVEESLMMALPVAFRDAVDQRTQYPAKTIEFAESYLQKSVEEITSKIGARETEAEEQQKRIVEAQDAATVATEAASVAQDASIVAQNNFLNASEFCRLHAVGVQGLTACVHEVTTILAAVRQKHEKVSATNSLFQKLVEGGAAGAAMPKQEAAESLAKCPPSFARADDALAQAGA